MKATTYVLGILFAGALSMGCVAQAGTDEASQAEQGLTIEQQNPVQAAQQQQGATAKQRVQHAPRTVTQPVDSNQLPELGLEEVTGVDPGSTVTDDGDGKEPDPHPWHVDTATRASH
jgi:hypothetical protein